MQQYRFKQVASESFTALMEHDGAYRVKHEKILANLNDPKSAGFVDFAALGNYLLSQGAWEASRQAYAGGFRHGESAAVLWNNIGYAWETQGEFQSAIASYQNALDCDPLYSFALGNLHHCAVKRGLSFFEKDDDAALEQCERWLFRALSVNPRSGWASLNLGNVNVKRHRHAEAEFWFRQSIRFDKNPATAKNNLAHLLLKLGRLQEGFELYEARRHSSGFPSTHAFFDDKPYWDGRSDLNGKCIYLHWEQGFGDMLQYSRFVFLLRKRYPRVRIILDTMSELYPFLQQLEDSNCRSEFEEPAVRGAPVDHVIINDQRNQWLAQTDLVYPIMSLAKLFTTNTSDIFAPRRYFSAFRGSVELEQQLESLQRLGRRLIGVSWAGRPSHGNDKHRSIHLRDLAPAINALNQWGFTIVSLQMGEAEKQIEECGLGNVIKSFGPKIKSFVDSSAIISKLEHFICVDSANLHLAGSLGVRCTALIPVRSDFRWFLNRKDTPWYPSISLFRQTKEGQWGEQLHGTLIAHLQERLPLS